MGLIASPFAYYGPLAQLVEHLTFNQVVEGSIPSRLISFFPHQELEVPIV